MNKIRELDLVQCLLQCHLLDWLRKVKGLEHGRACTELVAF